MALQSPQGFVTENIQQHLSSSVYMDYVQSVFGLSSSDIWNIDWNLHHQILRSLHKKYFNVVHKLIWNKNYTMETAYTHGASDSPKCSLCSAEDDLFHFLRCRSVRAHRKAIFDFRKLKSRLTALNISATMWHIIRSHIESGQPPPLW